MTKICSKCKINKPLDDYYKDARKRDGKFSECKSCNIARQKRYKKSDKGKLAQAKYNKTDKGKLAQSKYKKSDKGKLAQSNYKKSDKGKLIRIKCNHNRKTNVSNTLKDFTTKESKIVMFLQGYRCAWCGEYFDIVDPTLDHIVPVSKGGFLVIENVQYLCQKHNSMKATKEIDLRSDIHKKTIKALNI